MRIIVKLFATLREGRFEQKVMDFPEGFKIEEVIRQIDLPAKVVSLIFVNGRHADLNTRLSEEDTVSIFPPVGGG